MKSFKYLLIAAMTAVLCSCGYDISDVEEDIKGEIESTLEAEYGINVTVGDVVLTNVSGNEYTGVVTVYANGTTETLSLYVIFDGESYTWELYE